MWKRTGRWSFTTSSLPSTTSRLTDARDDALARLPEGGPDYEIDVSRPFPSWNRYTLTEIYLCHACSCQEILRTETVGQEVEENPFEDTRRRITGRFAVPLYLTDAVSSPASRLVLDDGGRPVFQGFAWWTFQLIIPRSCGGTRGCRAAQMGHGLFGSYTQVSSGYARVPAEQFGYITFMCDMVGMSSADSITAALVLGSDLTDWGFLPDRSVQGIVNSLVLMKLIRGSRFSADPAMIIDGVPAVDQQLEPMYFGHSQGGISGGVYLALSPDVRRAMLGVPGAPYSLLLPRSIDFDPFLLLLFLRYGDPVERISLMHVLQTLWDRAEPAGFLNLLASQPEKTALFQYERRWPQSDLIMGCIEIICTQALSDSYLMGCQ
jgi:hypothetical protein